MKVLKIIGIAILAAIIVFVAVVFVQPSHGHVEKSIVIDAPPSKIYAEINNYKNFNAWSPWAKMDPNAKYSVEGEPEGVGAKMSWDGEKIGKGSQWIEESVENKLVKTGLSFEGSEGKAFAEFVLTPEEGNKTHVMWHFEGENKGFGGKAMWIFVKYMLGTQFEQGLQDLKKVIEAKKSA